VTFLEGAGGLERRKEMRGGKGTLLALHSKEEKFVRKEEEDPSLLAEKGSRTIKKEEDLSGEEGLFL